MNCPPTTPNNSSLFNNPDTDPVVKKAILDICTFIDISMLCHVEHHIDASLPIEQLGTIIHDAFVAPGVDHRTIVLTISLR